MIVCTKTVHFINFQKLSKHKYRIVSRQFLCTKNDSVKNDEDARSEPQDPKAAAKNKLDSLLSSMKVQNTFVEKSSLSLKLAKPLRDRKKKKDDESGVVKEKNTSGEAKDKEDPSIKKKVNENMVAAVKAVASSLGGDIQKTESELIKKLLSYDSKKHKTKTDTIMDQNDLSNLFSGMKIEKIKDSSLSTHNGGAVTFHKNHEQFYGEDVLRANQTAFQRINNAMQLKLGATVNIFGAQPLNIFDIENKDRQSEFPHLELWEKLTKRDLDLLGKPPPSNAYEEMIRWTEAGKFWTFPINNEAGMDEEMKVGFHEHIFLEYLLEDFPRKGPVRHFMELVLTGLSKNPYITVQRKKDHVEWFRQYFSEKENILRATGAIE